MSYNPESPPVGGDYTSSPELVSVSEPLMCESSQDSEFRHMFYLMPATDETPQSIECLFCQEVLQK